MRKMFSKNQIRELARDVLATDDPVVINGDLEARGDVEVDGDLVANTLLQTNANWALDIQEFPTTTNCTGTVIYGRVQQVNQELQIIMLGKVHNDTASDINAYSLNGILVTLPESIASKIYDVLGNNASTAPDNFVRIAVSFASAFREGNTAIDMSKFSQCIMSIMNASESNKIRISFNSSSAIVLKANADTYFEGRILLSLV